MGPREPAGSALAAILGSAQAPSVETALALTERNSLKANHGVVCVADAMASRRATSLKREKVLSHTRVRAGFEDNIVDSDGGPNRPSRSTVANTHERSSRVPVTSSKSNESERAVLEDDDDGGQSKRSSGDQ